MNNCFEYYTLKLKTRSPVFVGNGKEVGKKEFYYSSKKDIIRFIDMNKLMEYMLKTDMEDGKNRIQKFEDFMINKSERDKTVNLYRFIKDIAVDMSAIKAMTIYKVKNNGCFDDEHSLSAISCFMRNKENKAYIPGSSVKGMLRTVLLQYLIRENNYQPHCMETDKKGNPKPPSKILAEEAENAEKDLINILPLKMRNGRPNINDAVNSIMKGLSISDSEFIDDSNFIVCRKFDIPGTGSCENKMNSVRECLKRGVEVEFKIKIDKRYFKPENIKLSFEQLFNKMVAEFDKEYSEFYLSKFPIPDGNKNDFNDSFVILGGGSGFFGKNITYTMNGFRKGLKKTSDNMKKNKINGKFVNPNDYSVGISPHMLKDTKIGDVYFHLGLCSVSLEREIL